PNEGLSEQHLIELAASGVPARRFDLNHNGLPWEDGNTVQVIEITKLVEEKRGGGVSVPVEAFEGRNLIFVDEGHKGSGGEVWRRYRDALGATVKITAGGRSQWREVMTSKSYLSASELPVTFGLGKTDKVEAVEILWPGGTKQTLPHVAIDTLTVVEQPK
ncbi:MAG: ASPIC/UnbV domain-containing protein, partial [Verrucomicrobiota bacterium]